MSATSLADWTHLPPREYFEANYAKADRVDLALAGSLSRYWRQIGPVAASLEFGTGPNLYPALIGLPYARRAVLTDVSEPNLDWIRAQQEDLDSRWLQFVPGDYDSHQSLLRSAEVRYLDMRVTPRPCAGTFDVVGMHFVAENLATTPDELSAVVGRAVGRLAHGGSLIMSFLEGFVGSHYGGEDFKAHPFSAEEIAGAVREHATVKTLERHGRPPGRHDFDGIWSLHAVS